MPTKSQLLLIFVIAAIFSITGISYWLKHEEQKIAIAALISEWKTESMKKSELINRGPATADCSKFPITVSSVASNFKKATGYTLHEKGSIPGFNTAGQEDLMTWTNEELLSIELAVPHLHKIFLNLNNLSDFYRYPRGYRPKSMNDATAAFATSRDGVGFIVVIGAGGGLLKDVGSQGNFMRGLITHEIAHRLDLKLGGDGYHDSNGALSQTSEWKNLSGWTIKEYRKDGVNYRQWDTDKENFIRDYARTNPEEDFAESVSAYQWQIPDLSKLGDDKVKYIKTKVFNGEDIVRNPIHQQVIDAVRLQLQESIPTIQAACQGQSDEPICLVQKVSELLPQYLDQVAMKSAGDCFVVDANRDQVLSVLAGSSLKSRFRELGIEFVTSDFNAEFEAYSKTIAKLKQIDVKSYLGYALSNDDPKAAYAKYLERDLENLKTYFLLYTGDSTMKPEELPWFQKVLDQYRQSYSYEMQIAQFMTFIESKLREQQATFSDLAKNMVSNCKAKGHLYSQEKTETDYFDGGAKYLDSGCLYLINLSFDNYEIYRIAYEALKSEHIGYNIKPINEIAVRLLKPFVSAEVERAREESKSLTEEFVIKIREDIKHTNISLDDEAKCTSTIGSMVKKSLYYPYTQFVSEEAYKYIIFISPGDLEQTAVEQVCKSSSAQN